ncbi:MULTISPECIES: hypothetical protein [unclassified Micromonospora]|uniref:hypothetical protein n=1 Tax=unclassified Micromonospora TaxID=2617518 RepID=UPI001C22E13E|nr:MULTISPECIES: hypothetical protein [unclassified Micromonospora]MBU8855907.1 hypothetical protein [Micromonospora sp. WMMB482]MDM4781511.1 hypothetical protein [Micromonospora sp. b486]
MGTTVARHLAGAAAAWLVVVAEAVLGYLGLLAYALVTGADPGGPLAGPLLVLIAALLGVAALPLLFAPAVALGEAAGRGRPGPALAFAGLVAVVLVTGYAAAVAVATDVPGTRLPLVAGTAALLVLPPTVAYAFTARGVGWTARLVRHRVAGARAVRAEAG